MKGLFSLLFASALSASVFGTNIVFTTRATFDGNLGGLAGADAKCNAAAAAVGLPGTYKAWLGSSAGPAGDRMIHSSYPYRASAIGLGGAFGILIANNWSDLTDGTLANSLSSDESGIPLNSGNLSAWTAMNTDFTYFGSNCTVSGQTADWAGRVGNTRTGAINATNSTWQSASSQFCSNISHLYCVQQLADTDPLYISGRARSDIGEGRGITHAKVTITGTGLSTPLVLYTDRDGSFITPALQPSGTYSINVSHRRYSFPGLPQTISAYGPGTITNLNLFGHP
jgi:hypothetical protein